MVVKYGTNCQEICSSGCQDNICTRYNGYCTCKTNFSGNKCESCIQVCTRYNGYCTCKTNFSGNKCESCIQDV
ncbi:multiple epidermal growth factor-like domains protein 10 [Patella vulgata]|uniref:multiple epidermal growth factor-like domains protein 10 n=1 Tax=Patella vulgata TaxID=6465 RepID=UPI0024A98EBD|nr:multiple epidermal growth factor-like domains protein 10 [Patella vulgata]